MIVTTQQLQAYWADRADILSSYQITNQKAVREYTGWVPEQVPIRIYREPGPASVF